MNTDLVPQSLDEKARRVYWTQQMDEAYAFMQAIRSYPVNECGEKCICMRDVAASEEIEVSFAEGPQVNGLPRLFYLREGLIGAFIAAAWEMNEYGWIMRIEDAFRTREMQRGNTLSERVFDVVLRKCVWECGDDSFGRPALPPSQRVNRQLPQGRHSHVWDGDGHFRP